MTPCRSAKPRNYSVSASQYTPWLLRTLYYSSRMTDHKPTSDSFPIRATAPIGLLHPPEYHSNADLVRRGRRGYPRWFPGATAYFYTVVARAMHKAATHAASAESLSDSLFVKSSNDLLRAAERCGAEVHVTGLEHVQKQCGQGPVVFVANHMSTLETFTLPGILLPLTPLTFVLKQELMNFPLLGQILKTMDPVTVSRDDPRADLKEVLHGGTQRLQQGRSVTVFPQTTRRTDFDAESFNSLGVKLAARASVPVIPLALKTDFWSTGRFIKDFGPIRPARNIHFAFGPPIAVDRQSSREAHQRIVAFVREHLQSWGVPIQAAGQ